jgi:hypothetical protein
MARPLKPGDTVTLKTSRGRTEGTVEMEVTALARVKAHVATASPGHSEYVVKWAKSGKNGCTSVPR